MKTTNWIHFIGKSYYSVNKFIKEAVQMGISRAVSLQTFKNMEFGDRVFLAQGDSKGSKIFGFFIIESVLGIGKELQDQMEKEGIIEKDNNSTPVIVQRGCGSYMVSGTSIIRDYDKFMDIVKNADKEQLDRLMIGGEFHYLQDCGIDEEFVITNIPFQMGYRLFDFDMFKAEYEAVQGRKVKGQFYQSGRSGKTEISEIRSLTIENYKLK